MEIKAKALKFFIIGAGGAGSNLSVAFSVKGYPIGIINTAVPDCANISLPDSKKLLLDNTFDGAGRNIKIGETIFTENKNKISPFIKSNCKDAEYLIICAGGGGGSGTASLRFLVDACKIAEKPIGVIYTLPMNSEDNVTKSNCLRGLKMLNELLSNKKISPVIIIDNQMICEKFPSLTISKFWHKANFEISKIFDYFNKIPKRKSVYYSAIDTMDYAHIFSAGGFMTLGKSEIIKYHNKLALSEAIQSSTENGLMCKGYDLSQSTAAGIIIIGSESVLDKLPAKNIDYAYDSLKDIISHGAIFKGIYKDESVKDKLIILSVFSGLGLPEQRIDELKQAAGMLKDKNHNRLSFDFGESVEENEEEDPFLELFGNKGKSKF